ncbi:MULTISPECIES: DUF6765 family protein [unclassified Fusibacter]|uniref:DUF6765 family protein n=1 Tax=unclassified Fusibacter TaxID=2624464 RepID=UPI0010117EB9|nr:MULTISPECIES: DUF6765 family protein [unclassified Fusibacter]MCK8058214.1 hypothetical protein [Fusibacter sp. A2]NPE20797.1 hypothetical protein [Fusibacter sp. A1]RXV63002.1 hypothetical protein DWB64_03115 [Fusibacter sp. A1]
MKTDLHFYLIYLLAVKSGLTPQNAFTIAYSAEYIDDNTSKKTIHFSDGTDYEPTRSAYRDLSLLLTKKDKTLEIYLPFHFFPSGEGETFQERVKSHAHSEMMRLLKRFVLTNLDQEFGLYYLGIYVHILIDTFIHEEVSELMENKYRRMKTDMDLVSIRNFIFEIYHLFCHDIRYLKPEWFDTPSEELDLFYGQLDDFLRIDLPMYERVERWQEAYANKIFGVSLHHEYDSKLWFKEALGDRDTYSLSKLYNHGSEFDHSDWLLFQRAIKYHLDFCQHELFPKYGILI